MCAPRCWASIVLTNDQLLREPTAGEGILYDSNCTAPPRMGQALTVLVNCFTQVISLDILFMAQLR